MVYMRGGCSPIYGGDPRYICKIMMKISIKCVLLPLYMSILGDLGVQISLFYLKVCVGGALVGINAI